MWAAATVMRDPVFQQSAQMRFGQRYEPVEALPAQSFDDLLAEGVHLGAVRGGSEYLDPEGVDRGVEVSRENTVAIMEQESY